jgi:hypothetical protein
MYPSASVGAGARINLHLVPGQRGTESERYESLSTVLERPLTPPSVEVAVFAPGAAPTSVCVAYSRPDCPSVSSTGAGAAHRSWIYGVDACCRSRGCGLAGSICIQATGSVFEAQAHSKNRRAVRAHHGLAAPRLLSVLAWRHLEQAPPMPPASTYPRRSALFADTCKLSGLSRRIDLTLRDGLCEPASWPGVCLREDPDAHCTAPAATSSPCSSPSRCPHAWVDAV